MRSNQAGAPRQTIWSTIGADMAHYAQQGQAFQDQKSGLLRRLSIMTNPAVTCVILFRLSHRLHSAGLSDAARLMGWLNRLLYRVEIDPACRIGPGLYIPHPTGILFRGCAGRNLVLYAHSLVGPLDPVPMTGDTLAHCPVLGDDVTLGSAVMVLGPCRLGSRTRFAPPGVVTASVADDLTIAVAQGWTYSQVDVTEPLSAP